MERERVRIRQELSNYFEDIYFLEPEAINLGRLMRETSDGAREGNWEVFSKTKIGEDITILKRFTPDGNVTVLDVEGDEIKEYKYSYEDGEKYAGECYLSVQKKSVSYRPYTSDLAYVEKDEEGNINGTGEFELYDSFNYFYDKLHKKEPEAVFSDWHGTSWEGTAPVSDEPKEIELEAEESPEPGSETTEEDSKGEETEAAVSSPNEDSERGGKANYATGDYVDTKIEELKEALSSQITEGFASLRKSDDASAEEEVGVTGEDLKERLDEAVSEASPDTDSASDESEKDGVEARPEVSVEKLIDERMSTLETAISNVFKAEFDKIQEKFEERYKELREEKNNEINELKERVEELEKRKTVKDEKAIFEEKSRSESEEEKEDAASVEEKDEAKAGEVDKHEDSTTESGIGEEPEEKGKTITKEAEIHNNKLVIRRIEDVELFLPARIKDQKRLITHSVLKKIVEESSSRIEVVEKIRKKVRNTFRRRKLDLSDEELEQITLITPLGYWD